MDGTSSLDTEDKEILSGFVKIKGKCETDGYADGLSNGRDSVYQEAFDHGYEDAFKLAFQLGQYKGVLAAVGDTNVPPEFRKSARGGCQTCADPEIIKLPVQEQIKIQQRYNQELLENFVQKHGDLSQVLEAANTTCAALSSQRSHLAVSEVSSGARVGGGGQVLPRDLMKPGKSDW